MRKAFQAVETLWDRVTLAIIKKMPVKDSVFRGQAENWEGQDNVMGEGKKGTSNAGDKGENYEILIHW